MHSWRELAKFYSSLFLQLIEKEDANSTSTTEIKLPEDTAYEESKVEG